MLIKDQHIDVVIESLVKRIESLQSEIWYKDVKIEELKSKLEKAEKANGKL